MLGRFVPSAAVVMVEPNYFFQFDKMYILAACGMCREPTSGDTGAAESFLGPNS